MNLTFLEQKDNQVVFTGYKLVIFIPKEYFKQEIAEEYGRKISTLGIFIMAYYKDENAKPILYQMNLPENIFFTFSEQEDVKGKIKKDFQEDSYTKYTLFQNDLFIEKLTIESTYENTEKFVKLHYNAKIPKSVKYSDIHKLYLENMDTNDTDLKVPSSILEMMIGELARYKNNLEIPFRKAIASKDISELDYTSISIKELARINSTFTGITSEDMDASITAAVAKAKTGGVELDTPIEPVIKY
jgi:hypothetical protein